MRILVLTDLFPPVAFGGYELECAALVERLRERHDVLVLTTELDRDKAEPEPGVRRELPARPASRRVAALRAPLDALRAARLTRGVLDEFDPELVYVSNGAAMPQSSVAVAAGSGRPVVCRFSELWFASWFLRGDRFLRHLQPGERGLLRAWGLVARAVNRHPALRLSGATRFSAAISWASGGLRDEAGVPAAIQPTTQQVIYPATPRHETFRAVTRSPAPEPTIAYVGRLTTAKGAEVACEALALLRTEHGVGARLVFGGPYRPEMRAALESLARRRGIAEHVEFRGALATADVADVLATASVVVLPSVVFEAFPLVAIEAALARVPLVASRLGGIPEGLAHEQHALLFTPGDAAECAAALARVLHEPAESDARARRAFERAQEFTLEAYLDQSEELVAHAAR